MAPNSDRVEAAPNAGVDAAPNAGVLACPKGALACVCPNRPPEVCPKAPPGEPVPPVFPLHPACMPTDGLLTPLTLLYVTRSESGC